MCRFLLPTNAESGSEPDELLTRRKLLSHFGTGIAGLALTELLWRDKLLAAAPPPALRPHSLPHFPPRAKRAVHIYLGGGLSQVDSFDYKPELYRWHGKPMPAEGEVDTFN